MKNIAFLVSANKTIIFEEVAKKLEDDDCFAYWVTPSRYWYKWLLNKGIPSDRILNLPEKVGVLNGRDLSNNEIERISYIENAAKVSFSDMFFMDRILREKSYHYSYRCMLAHYDEISSFLINNKIISVFSEQTWNFEIMTTLACNIIGIESYNVDGVKVPDGEENGRFGFFPGYKKTNISMTNIPVKNDFDFAEKYLKEYRKLKEGTSYIKAHVYKPSFKIDWPKKLIQHIIYAYTDRYDLTRRPLYSLIRLRLKQLVNYMIISFNNPFQSIESISGKFILVALHKQPDSGLDVVSSEFVNQIKAFVRKMPAEYQIVIKDHSHALGLTSLSAYNNYKNIPSVVLVNPKVDSFTLIENAALVVTICGSMSLESALMGKRSLTFSENSFSEILIRKSVNPYDISSFELRKILSESPPDDEKLINYLAMIHANSYLGMPYDPTKSSIFRSEKNITNISNGFKSFLLDDSNG